MLTGSQTESKNEYLQNSAIAFENRLQEGINRSVLGIGNIKLDYSPSAKEKWYYNGQYQSSNNSISNTINSITNVNASIFETLNKADNTAIKQYIEWHKSYNLKHTTTLVINQAYDYNTPRTNWFTDQPFLAGLIPLQEDCAYRIEQVKKVKTNSVDALFKHYWIINNFNHLYTNVGNNYGNSRLETTEQQLLTNGNVNDFALVGFGNAVKYQLNDAYVGLEYKFRIGKWTNKPGLYVHWYHLSTEQKSGERELSKTLLQPQLNSDYEFNKSESLNFVYKLENSFPQATQLAEQFTLQNYNLVYRGNALLQNERYHNANLRYTKTNLYRGITWNAMASWNKKVRTIRNEIQLDGINQFNTPILSNNPETNYNVSGSFSKKIYRFNLRFNTNMSWFTYFQTINNTETLNNRNNQRFGVVLRTAHKKWPGFSVGYNKGFSQFSGLTQSQFQTDAITSDFDITIAKFWTFKCTYENLKNTNSNKQSNFYDIANTSLRYQKKNSPFGFEVMVNNLLDNKVKNDFSFSDYLISQRTTYVLPRVFLFSVSYKL